MLPMQHLKYNYKQIIQNQETNFFSQNPTLQIILMNTLKCTLIFTKEVKLTQTNNITFNNLTIHN